MLEVGLGAPARRLGPYPTFNALGAAPPVKFLGDRLLPGRGIRTYEGLRSKNDRVHVILQPDGNFVLYGDGRPLWWTGAVPGVNYAAMQTDGNFVVYKDFGRAETAAVWATDTAGRANAYLAAQDDGNLVLYWGQGGSALWSSQTNGFKYYGGPGKSIEFEDVLSVAGDVLAVAQVVVSFVPGIGAGINAAIAAGAALAKGENITDALAEATKNALPGGPVAAAAFDAAVAAGKAIASGQNIGDAALAATRAALPSEEAKRAFDVGLAVVHGQNVQQALVAATVSLAPEAKKVAATMFKDPSLLKLPVADVAKLLNTSPANVTAASKAINSSKPLVAAAAVPHKPPPQLKEAKMKPPTLVAAKRPPPKLTAAPPPVVVAAGGAKPMPSMPPHNAYAPYPPHGILSGPPPPHIPHHMPHHGGGGGGGHRFPQHAVFRGGRAIWNAPWETEVVITTPTCRTWSDPVSIPEAMQSAAKVAVGASGGRPTTLRGDDGTLYLLSLENGVLRARTCTSMAA